MMSQVCARVVSVCTLYGFVFMLLSVSLINVRSGSVRIFVDHIQYCDKAHVVSCYIIAHSLISPHFSILLQCEHQLLKVVTYYRYSTYFITFKKNLTYIRMYTLYMYMYVPINFHSFHVNQNIQSNITFSLQDRKISQYLFFETFTN